MEVGDKKRRTVASAVSILEELKEDGELVQENEKGNSPRVNIATLKK